MNSYIVTSDTLVLDSLSIIPGSLFVTTNSGVLVDSTGYFLIYPEALLIFKNRTSLTGDSIKISYRVFPYSLAKRIFHKDIRKTELNEKGFPNPFLMTYDNEPSELFKFGGLSKSGSISRGISFGNNQDVVVNSSLNLQMSGKVAENVDVLAAITDENIPYQADGNTQQLQEFDKVFIQLSGNKSKLIAGDYELRKPESYFMNFYKKAQGGSFTTAFSTSYDEQQKPKGTMKTGISAAVSKGKFSKNLITGSEGNQGPYRLTGANNELFIVILSGSEKVYLNGMLLERGLQHDYTMDYNTAQISFTPKRIITKDSRIVVEFEYSDKNYLRSLLYLNNEFEQNKWKVKINFFSEQDSKNQPLQQKLDDSQKKILKNIGDSLNDALISNVQLDTVEYNPDLVHYKKIDTLTNNQIYQSVFVYSTDPDSAIYQVGFSFTGERKGNYVPANTAANGKVYEWLAPLNGAPQGSYEPVTLLITPKMQQLYTLGADYAISGNTVISGESALSNYDKNTFSSRDSKDDIGLAEKISIKNSLPLSGDTSGWKFNTVADYEFIEKSFTALERFRPVEFERDWNLSNEKFTGEEHLAGGSIGFSKTRNGFVRYRYNRYNKGSNFMGYSNGITADLKLNNFRLISDASLMNSVSLLKDSRFLKHKADFSKAFRYLVIGAKEETEDNRFLNGLIDTLLPGSYSFHEWESYFTNPDTLINKFKLFYGQRYDNAVRANSFHLATVAENTGLSFSLLKNKNNKLSGNSTYRKLTISDSSLTVLKGGESLVNNIDHNLSLFKGGINFTTYYEIGTGQELKKEFAYLEVPAGQGSYTWIDYNGNGLKELDEFEIATSSDLATFVKVLIPTNDYVRTNSNQFSEVFFISPSSFFENPEGMKKFISRFSNQFLIRKDTKTTDNRMENILNPFEGKSVSDSSLVALGSSFQNIFYFNRSNSRFGFDLNIQENKNKSLLTNGFETRVLQENGINTRWNITRVFGINLAYKYGEKSNRSEFFARRDYVLVYDKTEPKFIIQTSTSFRITILYELAKKRNTLGVAGEHSVQNKAGTEIKYSTPKQGTILARFDFIQLDYNAPENSPIAYEMLDGLKKGDNFTWGLSVQRSLASGLQLSVNYEGRKSPSNKSIHTGGVQLRAYF